ncbi:MAG: hypothetical protein JO019_00815 [Candidatus Kaiserbacteria bacterium]|nr:hypothetical protein [Candidatus Kaiserbacteria bacterium]
MQIGSATIPTVDLGNGFHAAWAFDDVPGWRRIVYDVDAWHDDGDITPRDAQAIMAAYHVEPNALKLTDVRSISPKRLMDMGSVQQVA